MIFCKILVFFHLSFNVFALDIPSLSGPVMDHANIFTNTEKAKAKNIIMDLYRSAGPQLQIYTVKSLEGESLEGYTIEVVEKWKLGDKERDDGVLLFLAKDDRKVRIEVGDGLEGKLTDYKSRQIIDLMIPYFKKGNYGEGILAGTEAISKVIKGEEVTLPKIKKKEVDLSLTDIFYLILFFAALFFTRGGGLVSGYSRSSGSSWSGGGGSFSGGGSSGSW